MTTVPTPVLGGTSSDQATVHSGQLSWGVSPSLRPEQSLPVFQRTCCLVCRKWKHLGVLPCPLWAAHCDRAAQAQAPGDSLSRVHARGEQARPGLRGTPVWLGPYTPSGLSVPHGKQDLLACPSSTECTRDRRPGLAEATVPLSPQTRATTVTATKHGSSTKHPSIHKTQPSSPRASHSLFLLLPGTDPHPQ